MLNQKPHHIHSPKATLTNWDAVIGRKEPGSECHRTTQKPLREKAPSPISSKRHPRNMAKHNPCSQHSHSSTIARPTAGSSPTLPVASQKETYLRTGSNAAPEALWGARPTSGDTTYTEMDASFKSLGFINKDDGTQKVCSCHFVTQATSAPVIISWHIAVDYASTLGPSR